MVIRVISEHPIAAGLWAIFLLTLPSLAAAIVPSNKMVSMAMLLTMPFQIITPLPILLVGLKRGPRAGLYATLVLVAGALLLTQELTFPLLVFLVLGAFPLLAIWMLRNGWNFTQCSSAGFLLGIAFLIGLLLVSSHSPTEMEKALSASFSSMQERFVTLAQSQGADAKTILNHEKTWEQFSHTITFLFPTLLISGWYMVQLANLFLTRQLFAKRFGHPPPNENFTHFRVPFFLVWPIIAFGLILLLLGNPWYRFAANMVLFLAVPYFFQGLAVVQAMFQHLKVPAFWQVSFYVFTFLFSRTALVIGALGFFDTWLNVRIRLEKTGEGKRPSGR
ncbi:MAG: DUF2232 domain-containing protein [Magnetococcales bacterium]|nr:DUF2232 domain-containing protein [Magnetococcales bacterium]